MNLDDIKGTAYFISRPQEHPSQHRLAACKILTRSDSS